MKFVDFVRKGKMDGPLRRGFDRSRWSQELNKLGDDAADRNLHDAGLLIHDKLSEVRALVRFVSADSPSKTTKLRALVAMANQFSLQTMSRTREQLDVLARDKMPVAIQSLAIKLALPVGGSFSPDEIVEAIVDGAQIPIRLCLQQAGPLEGVPKFAEIDTDALWRDLNLGTFYRALEQLWEDCLWNGYSAHEANGGKEIRFESDSPEWVRRLRASRMRYSNLTLNLFGILETFRARGDMTELSAAGGVRRVQSVKKVGRKQVVVFAAESTNAGAYEEIAITRFYAAEVFYEEFMGEAQDALSGATVDQLLSAWILVRQIGNLMFAPLVGAKEGDSRPTHVWLPECVPLLQRTALISAVTKGLSISPPQAGAIVEFLTYRGKPDQELWAQPLVPASEDSLMPVFPALSAKAPRLLDVWLRQLGVKLERRGPAFEQHVRTEIAEFIGSSALKPTAHVLPQAIVFKPPKGREEEIDIVMCIGDAVVIGEAKCILSPAEPEQVARHRDTLIGAAAQIARKAAAASANRDAFATLLRDRGMQIPTPFRILPMVVINSAIHAGFCVDGVSIVDRHILQVFFNGQFTDTVMGRDGTRDVAVYRVYQTIEEAPDVLDKYLQAPPQLARYVGALRERWAPIGRLKPEDPNWTYLTFESAPELMPLPPVSGERRVAEGD